MTKKKKLKIEKRKTAERERERETIESLQYACWLRVCYPSRSAETGKIIIPFSAKIMLFIKIYKQNPINNVWYDAS